MSTNYVMLTRNKLIVLFLIFIPIFTTTTKVFSVTPEKKVSICADQIKSVIGTTNDTNNKEVIKISMDFFYSLAIDLATILLIIYVIYYPNYKKMDTIFTFILFNVIIFMLTFVLNKVKMSMGAAFGLFAVFSMLRYRTEGIGMKDMTYLFIFVALGLLSGIQMDLLVQGLICAIIFIITLLMDTKLIIRKEFTQHIRYEKVNLIKPENQVELIEDLKDRTGLDIHRIIINEIDYLRDIANITVYYYE